MNSVLPPSPTNQTETLIASLEKLAGELNGTTLNGLSLQTFELLGETLAELQLVHRKLQWQAEYQRQFEAIEAFCNSIRDIPVCAELTPIITTQIARTL